MTQTRPAWLPFAVVGAGVAVLAILFSAVSSPDNVPPKLSATFAFAGELRLDSSGAAVSGSSCTGEGGYSDVHAGTQVVVYGEAGSVLGAGALQDGFYEPGACVFRFSVPSIPRGEGAYQVEVGHRGRTVVMEEAASLGRTSLTLG